MTVINNNTSIRLPHHITVHQPALFSKYDYYPASLQFLSKQFPIFRQIKKDGNAAIRAFIIKIFQQQKALSIFSRNLDINSYKLLSSNQTLNLYQSFQNLHKRIQNLFIITQLNNATSELDIILNSWIRIFMLSKGYSKQIWGMMNKQIRPQNLQQLSIQLQLPTQIITEQKTYFKKDYSQSSIFYWKQTYGIIYSKKFNIYNLQYQIFGRRTAQTVQTVQKRKKVISILHQAPLYQKQIQNHLICRQTSIRRPDYKSRHKKKKTYEQQSFGRFCKALYNQQNKYQKISDQTQTTQFKQSNNKQSQKGIQTQSQWSGSTLTFQSNSFNILKKQGCKKNYNRRSIIDIQSNDCRNKYNNFKENFQYIGLEQSVAPTRKAASPIRSPIKRRGDYQLNQSRALSPRPKHYSPRQSIRVVVPMVVQLQISPRRRLLV